MDLMESIGPDTIAKLEAAAPARLAEAVFLKDAGHHLAAIYLCGYAVEMWLESAYFKLWDYLPQDEIARKRRDLALKAARPLIVRSHSSHPLDGWGHLLVAEKSKLKPPAYLPHFKLELLVKVDAIARHWVPHLRYRDLDPGQETTIEVIDAAHWLFANYPKF